MHRVYTACVKYEIVFNHGTYRNCPDTPFIENRPVDRAVVEESSRNKWLNHQTKCNYSRLSLSRIPRDSRKHFEISVPRHIRVERVRKTIN